MKLPPATVVLATMPYAHVMRPSIALGILKAALLEDGISCAVEYANIRFVEQTGIDVNSLMMHLRTDSLIGEWTFAGAAFRDEADTLDLLLGSARRHQPPNIPSSALDERRFEKTFRRLRAFAPEFVDETARRILQRRPKVVGCSSTFEQHCAGLALLRRVKELDPTVTVIIGGANCESEMGWATLKNCPWIDYVFSGEADSQVSKFCRDIMQGRNPLRHNPPGLLGQSHIEQGRITAFPDGTIPRALLANMDQSPAPDFEEYFETLEHSPVRPFLKSALAVETSRGCWWGQKSHCTFCGLNGAGMTYRSKSPEHILSEWAHLRDRYHNRKLFVVDNIIDMKHVRDLLPRLVEHGAPYDLFYETKSNLRREQVQLFLQAGISKIQPGIEGLHDDHLRLMAKGNTAVTNVQLLKYTRECGMLATWMILVGFPGEKKTWHSEVAEWLPLITHLQPPNGVVSVRFDRFSVYFNEQQRYGLMLKPFPAYSAVFPYPQEDLEDAAYFFQDVANPSSGEVAPEILELGAAVRSWVTAFRRPIPPVLCVTVKKDRLEFFDTRPCAPQRLTTLMGLDREVYLRCDAGSTAHNLLEKPPPVQGLHVGNEQIMNTLDQLIERKLVVNLHGKYVGLACIGDAPTLGEYSDYPNGHIDRFDSRRWQNATQAWEHLENNPPVFRSGYNFGESTGTAPGQS